MSHSKPKHKPHTHYARLILLLVLAVFIGYNLHLGIHNFGHVAIETSLYVFLDKLGETFVG